MEAFSVTRKSELPRFTEAAIRAFYRGDYAPLLSLATPDCTFIGAGNDVFFAIADMAANPPTEKDNPPHRIENPRFWLIETECPTQALVMGLYEVYSDLSTGLVTAANQRITVSCRLENGFWRAYCIHSSNEWGDPEEEGAYPLRTGRKTYEYVQRIVQTSLSKAMRKRRVSFNAEGGLTFVDPESIVYVESNGKSSIMHLVDGTLDVMMMLGEIEKELPDHFVRIHRYYLANIHLVRSFSHEGVTMVDGAVLPVPRRRIAEVRKLILDRADPSFAE